MTRRSITKQEVLTAIVFAGLGFGVKACVDHKGTKETDAQTEIVNNVAILDSLDNRTKRIEDVARSNNDKLNTIKIDADSIKQATADLKDSTHVIIEQAKKCCSAKKPVAPVKPVETVIGDCGCDDVPVMQAPSAPVCDNDTVYYQPEPAVAVVPNVPADNVVVVQNSEATVVINGNNNVVNVNQEPKVSDAECVDSVKHTVIMSVEFYCSRRGRRR